MEHYWTIGAMALAAILLIIFISLRMRRQMSRKITYMLDALEDGDVNFKYREDGIFNRNLNRTLNRIRGIFEKRRREAIEQNMLYGKVLDRVSTGIIIAGDNGSVVYSNESADAILGVYSLQNLRQTAKISKELCDALMTADESDVDRKVSFVSSMSAVTVLISISKADMDGHMVRIIVLNDISGQTQETEVASWIKLIRVLTHEIMNTVSPISSLSDILKAYTDSSSKPELKEGLETISASSKGLIKFVESYRSLTRIPEPVRKAHYISDIIARAISLTETYRIPCTYTGREHDLVIYADENQILQVLVNLFRNAIQAGAGTITIHSRMDVGGSIFIDIVNDGEPVSEKNREEIFIPFYTTKTSGSGIGLSLSRQIMRLHGGNLLLTRSDSDATVFTLIFR